MTQMRKVDVTNMLGRKVTLDIETSESNAQEFMIGRRWSAALNGFYVACIVETGETEDDAIRRLCERLSCELVSWNGCL